MDEADAEAQFGISSLSLNTRVNANAAAMTTLLVHMPEPDSRSAVELTLSYLQGLEAAAERLTTICLARGIPWRVDPLKGFVWTGDEIIERDVVQPALTILNDPASQAALGPSSSTPGPS